MFFRTENGLAAGPWDVVAIVQDHGTGRYHSIFMEDRPMPGGNQGKDGKVKFIRLKSKMHHTGGFETLPEAQKSIDDMLEKGSLAIDPLNLMGLIVIDGWTASDPAVVQLLPNWREAG